MKCIIELLTGPSTVTSDGQAPPNSSKLRLPQTCESLDPSGGWCMLGTRLCLPHGVKVFLSTG